MATYRVDTRTLNALLTTTLDAYSAEMADTIFSSNFAYWMFKKKGCFKSQDGGAYLREPVMFQVNSTAKWYEGYETLDTTPQDGMTDGIMPWASAGVSVAISREEERKNSGRSRLINLLEKKIMQSENSLIEIIGDALCDVGKYNISQTTKQMAGLDSMISSDPTQYDVCGLDGSNSWWKNKVKGNAGTDFTWIYDNGDTPAEPTGVAAMRNLYNNCRKGAGGAPDLIFAGQYAYEKYEGGLGAMQRFADEASAAAGFDTLRFKGAVMSWADKVKDTQASITAANAETSKALIYMINTKFWEIIYDSQSLFAHEGFVRPENQTARTSLIVFMGNMHVTNRRKQGILVDANKTDITN